MLDALPENDVRYAVIDIFYDTNEGSRAEIYFIAWYNFIIIIFIKLNLFFQYRAPDTATIKRKMLCASSKDALKNALQGIRNHIQATCKADLDLAAIISEKTKSK